jgi:hypothetical protein
MESRKKGRKGGGLDERRDDRAEMVIRKEGSSFLVFLYSFLPCLPSFLLPFLPIVRPSLPSFLPCFPFLNYIPSSFVLPSHPSFASFLPSFLGKKPYNKGKNNGRKDDHFGTKEIPESGPTTTHGQGKVHQIVVQHLLQRR